jgi:hypothetical protein
MKISLSSLSYLFVLLSLLVLSLSFRSALLSSRSLSFTSWAQQAPGSAEWPAEDAAPEPASARPLLRGGVLLPPGPVILGSPLVVASSAWTTSVGSCCCLERARSGGGDDAELATGLLLPPRWRHPPGQIPPRRTPPRWRGRWRRGRQQPASLESEVVVARSPLQPPSGSGGCGRAADPATAPPSPFHSFPSELQCAAPPSPFLSFPGELCDASLSPVLPPLPPRFGAKNSTRAPRAGSQRPIAS